MDTYITAQIIGFLGYIFLTYAPNFNNQKHIIQMDIMACVFLCTQWAILEQPALLVLNILNILVSLFVLKVKQHNITQKVIPISYPLGCIALLLVSQGTAIDALCIIAFCALVRAKSSQNIFTFRYFSIFAGIAFTICGFVALSLPAILFNAAYVLLHMRKVREFSKIAFKPTLQN